MINRMPTDGTERDAPLKAERKVADTSEASATAQTAAAHESVPPRVDDASVPYREVPRPQDIVADIESRSPFQQEQAAQQYRGLKVAWPALLQFAKPEPDGQAFLMMLSAVGSYPWISCEIPVEQHVEIKTLKQNAQIRVKGVIRSVSGNMIELDACSATAVP